MNPHEQFNNAMAEVKLRQCDLARLTGHNRRTIWRWQTGKSDVPAYAWTIVRNHKKIRELTAELCG